MIIRGVAKSIVKVIFQHPKKGEAVTGAPVKELEYKQLILPYLKRSAWRHVGELGWYHEV
jgi:hypothetical protein